jgi:hypothetical protein
VSGGSLKISVSSKSSDQRRRGSLVRELAIPAKAEQYEEEGFKYHPDLGISVRRQSASDCWKEVERLGQEVAHPGHCRVLAAAEPEGAIPRQDGHIAVTESVELV